MNQPRIHASVVPIEQKAPAHVQDLGNAIMAVAHLVRARPVMVAQEFAPEIRDQATALGELADKLEYRHEDEATRAVHALQEAVERLEKLYGGPSPEPLLAHQGAIAEELERLHVLAAALLEEGRVRSVV